MSRSLRQSCRRYEVRFDTAFAEVIDACADRRPAGGWITDEIRDAYVDCTTGLGPQRRGVERATASWCGGLYGVAIGGFFAGESMFHRGRDASKVALVGLVEQLQRRRPQRGHRAPRAGCHRRPVATSRPPRRRSARVQLFAA